MPTALLKSGIHADIPFHDYLDHPGYGSSDLRTMRIGPPARVLWRRAHREKSETDATRIGTAAHCTILDPTWFDRAFWIKPPLMEFRSAENKAVRDEVLASGRQIITQDAATQIRGVAQAFADKALARESLHGAFSERSVFWRDPITGIMCKCRPDWFDADCVYDLKVSIHAEKEADTLTYRAHTSGWLNQLAHNRAGLNANGRDIKRGRIVVIEPNEPHSVWLLEVRENDLDHLELDNEIARRKIAKCEASGEWPGTPDQWRTIELPASAVYIEDNDLEAAEEVLP